MSEADTRPGAAERRTSARDYVLDEQIGFVLRRVHQRASEIFSQTMAEFEITPTQFAALAKLHEVGETSQNQLGRMTAMDPATILGVVNRLRNRGLVAQRTDPSDARRVLLSLSDEGRAGIAAMEAAALQVSERTLAPLSKSEAARLLELLARLS